MDGIARRGCQRECASMLLRLDYAAAVTLASLYRPAIAAPERPIAQDQGDGRTSLPFVPGLRLRTPLLCLLTALKPAMEKLVMCVTRRSMNSSLITWSG